MPPQIVVNLFSQYKSRRGRGLRALRSNDIAGEGKPRNVDDECHKVRDHSDHQEKFPKISRTPGSFQVLSAVENCGKGDGQGEDVLLDKSAGNKSPWEDD